MGAWDIGPFDNDMAADFGGALDHAEPGERVEKVRAAHRRTRTTAPRSRCRT